MGLYFCWRSWTSSLNTWHHGLYQIPTDTVRNLIMGHVWIFQCTIIQTQTSKTTQKWVTEHKTKLLLWPFQSSDLNSVEHEWGWTKEKKHRHRAGNLKVLEWFWMKEWSLISCQVFSNIIRYYKRTFRAVKLTNGGFKKYWLKGCL